MKKILLSISLIALFTSCEKVNCECGRVLYETAIQKEVNGTYEQFIYAQLLNDCSGNIEVIEVEEAVWFSNVIRNGQKPYLNGQGASNYCLMKTW